MMTDRKKLEEMMTNLLNTEKESYDRMKKENILLRLIISTDEVTGKLSELIIVPMYEHNGEFLKKTLEELGYVPEYKEEYNDFFQGLCHIVNL